MDDFLAFVDANSQPNGRSSDSTSATFYFLSKFSTLKTPKAGCPQYEEHLSRSLVREFNRAQHEGECSNGSCHNWLKQHRPKHTIRPHQQDYCDTCAQHNANVKAKQTTLNRLQQAAASQPEELEQLSDEIKAMKQSDEIHCQEANDLHDYYSEAKKKCTAKWD